MADLRRTIDIIFGGQDNTAKAFKSISRNFNKLDASVQAIAEPLGDIADQVLKAEAAIIALGAATLAFSRNEAVKLQDSQAGLQKVLSANEGSVDQYSSAIKDLAITFGTTGEATTDTVTEFKQAGFSISESLELTKTAMTGVRIAEMETNEAGGYLIATIRGLGTSADQATKYMDAWNEVSNKNSATAKELAEATSKLAPISSATGISFEKMVGLVTPLVEKFRDAGESANGLKSGLTSLISDQARVTRSLKELGVAQKDSNGNLRLAGDVLDDLGGLWSGLTESQKANYGLQLFGKEQFARMSAVLNDYNRVLKVTAEAQNSAGSAAKELDVVFKKASVASQRLSSAFQYAGATLGKEFLPSSVKVVNATRDLTESFIKVVDSGGLDDFFKFLNPLLENFADNIKIIAKNLPDAFDDVDLSKLIQSFSDLGDELERAFNDVLGGNLDLTSVEGLTDAIQKAVNLVTSLTNATTGILEQFSPIFKAIGEGANRVAGFDSETSKLIGNILGAGKILRDFGTAFGAIAILINQSGTDIGRVFDGIIGGSRIISNALTIPLRSVALLVTRIAQGLANLFSTITWGDWSDEFERSAEQLRLSSKKLEGDIATDFMDMGSAWDQATGQATKATDKLTRAADNQASAQERVEKANIKSINSFDELMRDLDLTTQAQDNNTKSLETNNKKKDEAAERSKALAEEQRKQAEQVKLILAEAELAGKVIEAQVKLDIANIEANAKIAEATIKNLETVFKSTGDVLGDLLGQDWSKMSSNQQAAVRTQIRNEDKMRRESFELQKQLTEAQIENLNANTDRLNSGDAMISISADGLEPELEAFMWQILDRIKLKATQDQANFLLGL